MQPGTKWDTESAYFREALRNRDVSAEEALVQAITHWPLDTGRVTIN